MFSTKCTYCRTLINLKNEELRAAIDQTEAEHQSHYSLHCPKCGRVNKIQVKELKRHLPPEATPAEATPTEAMPDVPPADSTNA